MASGEKKNLLDQSITGNGNTLSAEIQLDRRHSNEVFTIEVSNYTDWE